MNSDVVDVFFSHLTLGTDEEKLLSLFPFVSKERRERVLRYQRAEDKKLSLYSAILLRDVVCGEVGVSNTRLSFLLNEAGKPYAREHRIEVSLSHTKMAVSAAVSFSKVGVDVEKLRQKNESIISRCFLEDEREYVNASPNPDLAFLEIWTRKEARLKMSGEKSLSASVLNGGAYYESFLREGYLITVCSEKEKKVFFSEISEFELEHPRLCKIEEEVHENSSARNFP